MVLWDDLGFATNYEVDGTPEFPSDGEWGLAEVLVGVAQGYGGPEAIITPTDARGWVLRTRFDTVGSLYGTPDPDAVCVTDRFRAAIIVDVRDPVNQTHLPVANPVSVAGDPETGLLYIADEQQVYAFGTDGFAWQSPAIYDYDLRIRRTDNGRIVCSGRWFSSVAPFEVTLDARTGAVLSG